MPTMPWAQRPVQREKRVQYKLARNEFIRLVNEAICEQVGGGGTKQTLYVSIDTDWPTEIFITVTTQEEN